MPNHLAPLQNNPPCSKNSVTHNFYLAMLVLYASFLGFSAASGISAIGLQFRFFGEHYQPVTQTYGTYVHTNPATRRLAYVQKNAKLFRDSREPHFVATRGEILGCKQRVEIDKP